MKAEQGTLEVIERFNAAFNGHDVDEIMALMTDDVVFESTYPPPDGKRYGGRDAVGAVWQELFAVSPDAHFEGEETFTCSDRAVVRWRYTFTDGDGRPRHLRGVDVMRVRDGKVAEKLSYVKG
ncbi:MAG: nuclear transport factor 2 family protein [Actinomycetota bacterium]